MKSFLPLLILVLFIASCDVRDNEFDPQQRFTRIYDDEQLSNNYYPVDIRQTADGGYMVMGILGTASPYFMKTDAFGEKLWESSLGGPYEYPAPDLLQIGDRYYFFCKSDNGLNQTYLMEVSQGDGSISEVSFFEDYTYPVSAIVLPDNGVLFMGYNSQNRATQLVRFSSGLSVSWDNEFNAFDESIGGYLLDQHLRRQGTPIPFFLGYEATETGQLQSLHFNGYEGFTLKTVFVNPSTGGKTGTLFGFQTFSGMTSLLSLGSGAYAAAQFDIEGENYLNPIITVDANANVQTSSYEETGQIVNEIPYKGYIHSELIEVDGNQISAYLTTTTASKILLRLYDIKGNYRGERTFGFNELYQASEVVQTADGGLAILGLTTVKGTAERLVIFKISKEDLAALIQ